MNDQYELQLAPSAALLAAADAANVIAIAAPAGAVWARTYQRNLPAQYETTWFVDAATGSDANSGTVIGAPLQTMRELCNRLRGARIGASVVVTVAAGDYSASPVELDLEIPPGVTFQIVGAVTSTTDTLAAVVNTVSGAPATNAGAVRGLITATAAAFTDKQRLRTTSGATSGAIAYVTRVTVAGVGGQANVSRWGLMATPATGVTVTEQTPTAGTTYALDTLGTILGLQRIRVTGAGRLTVRDCIIRAANGGTIAGASHTASGDTSINGNGVMYYGCKFESLAVSLVFGAGAFTASLCQMQAQTTIEMVGVYLTARMCTFTNQSGLPTFIRVIGGAQIDAFNEQCFDGMEILLGSRGPGTYTMISGSCQFCDGVADHGIDVEPNGQWTSGSTSALAVWGLDNSYNVSTIEVASGGFYGYVGKPSIPGGPSDVEIGGVLGSYAAGVPAIVTTSPGGLACMTEYA